MNITLPADVHTVGVYLSGGVESSLLTYLVAEQYPHLDIKACILIKPNRINLTSVANVLAFIEQRTGKSIIRRDVHAAASWNPSQVIVGWGNLLLNTQEIDVLLTGGNDYPITELPNMPVRQYMAGERVLHPFRGMLKTEIFELYRQYNVLDLLPLTHSCFDNMEQHCGICVNCRERLWAHEKTNIPFTGVINYGTTTPE